MIPKTRKWLADKIASFEYYDSGYKWKAASDVKAVNVKIKKDRVYADIILTDYNENSHQRTNNCNYDLKAICGKNAPDYVMEDCKI